MQCCAPVNPNVLFNGSCNTLLFLIFLHTYKLTKKRLALACSDLTWLLSFLPSKLTILRIFTHYVSFLSVF